MPMIVNNNKETVHHISLRLIKTPFIPVISKQYSNCIFYQEIYFVPP